MERHGDRMKTYPAQCVECKMRLTVGVAFYMLVCHIHALCSECGVARNNKECLYCKRREEEIEHRRKRASTDARNSLPVLSMTNTVGVRKGPPALKFQYPALHSTPTLQRLSYNGHFTLPRGAWTCWAAGYEDYVIVGGMYEPTLTVVTPVGNMIQHSLTRGYRIVSGLFIKPWMYLICVWYGNYRKVHLVLLDPTSNNPTSIRPFATLDVGDPGNVFNISKQLYGVLCIGDEGASGICFGRIRLLDLATLILPKGTDPSTLQSTALYGKRTLRQLNLPAACHRDTVAVTPRGQYCVVSSIRSEVRVYSRTGAYLYTLGIKRNDNFALCPGHLLYPLSVQCTADNILVITGLYGDIHFYNMESTSGSMITRRLVEGCLDEEDYTEDHVKKMYLYKSDLDGWRVMKDDKDFWYSTIAGKHMWIITTENKKLHSYTVHFRDDMLQLFLKILREMDN